MVTWMGDMLAHMGGTNGLSDFSNRRLGVWKREGRLESWRGGKADR